MRLRAYELVSCRPLREAISMDMLMEIPPEDMEDFRHDIHTLPFLELYGYVSIHVRLTCQACCCLIYCSI